MTDDLDKLRAALKAAPPAPDAEARSATLARALESFDRAQESAEPVRPMSDRPVGAGFLTGVRKMLATLTTRPALAATASVAALCVGLVAILPALRQEPGLPKPVSVGTTEVKKEAPPTGAAPQPEDLARAKTAEPAPATVEARTETPAAPEAEVAGAMSEPVLEAVVPSADALDDNASSLGGTFAVEESGRAQDSMAAGQATGALSAPEADLGYVAQVPAAPAEALVLEQEFVPLPDPNTEAFANAEVNPVRIVAEDPVSTFSIDVDTASYSVVRSSLASGYLPPAEAVRIEEMVNYFPYAYPAPEADGAPFRPTLSVIETPWNPDTRLVHVAIQGRLPALADRPPLNLVFLIDTSGSMDEQNKLPLLQQSFRLLLGQLRPTDQVAIVTYAGSAGEVLEPTPASDRAAILSALDRLAAGGSTAGQEGLQQAYQVAEGMKAEGEVTRILLATDGDFNIGIADPAELTDYIAEKRDSGTYLSVLGFGRGNLDDATMQALAQNGNGQAAYIDTLSEAQKVLVDQLTGALFPIANDVKIQVEFNPAAIAEYRLIGYETRTLAREDFNNDTVDAGEIGAGHQVTALYEVTPVGSPALLNDPLRYTTGATDTLEAHPSELGFLKMRWKEPGEQISTLIELPIPIATGEASEDVHFAAAIAGFGQLLSGAKYLGNWGWADAVTLASGAKGTDSFGYRAEAVQLMRLGQSLSAQ